MSTAPTGLEPITPVAIKQVSVTERADFRKCRRRWFLKDVHRLNGPSEEMYFRFGTVMHAALEAYHDPALSDALSDGIKSQRAVAAVSAFNLSWGVALDAGQAELGFLWKWAEQEWLAHEKLGRLMLEGYFRSDATSRFEGEDLGRVVATERRYTVKIPGTNGKLTGKLDLITEIPPRWEKRGVDHKNLASQHSSAQLDLDDQLTGYAWLYYKAEGEPLTEVAYNVLLKKLPFSEKTGKPTTSKLYVRDITFRTEAQLRQFEDNLKHEWRDMRRVAAHPEQAYPNPSPFNCGGCPVRMICVAMMNEEDVESVIQSSFVIGDVRT